VVDRASIDDIRRRIDAMDDRVNQLTQTYRERKRPKIHINNPETARLQQPLNASRGINPDMPLGSVIKEWDCQNQYSIWTEHTSKISESCCIIAKVLKYLGKNYGVVGTPRQCMSLLNVTYICGKSLGCTISNPSTS
jgi:hypothetical protein